MKIIHYYSELFTSLLRRRRGVGRHAATRHAGVDAAAAAYEPRDGEIYFAEKQRFGAGRRYFAEK